MYDLNTQTEKLYSKQLGLWKHEGWYMLNGPTSLSETIHNNIGHSMAGSPVDSMFFTGALQPLLSLSLKRHKLDYFRAMEKFRIPNILMMEDLEISRLSVLLIQVCMPHVVAAEKRDFSLQYHTFVVSERTNMKCEVAIVYSALVGRELRFLGNDSSVALFFVL